MGSSPLARGPRYSCGSAGADGRIIPARAGSTAGRETACPSLSDHPRSRGVHMMSLTVTSLHLWIIPARAGSTERHGDQRAEYQDHPRSRGVHHPWSAHRPRRRGSSPLARGPLWLAHFKHIDVRIIPARAGSTLSMPGLAKPGRDHPRSRGVHHLSPERATRSLGSSPLARGPLAVPLSLDPEPGSSPLARGPPCWIRLR